jgi:hypothetical protein
LTSTLSISTRVWFASAPRMRTCVKVPTPAPDRLTASPGTVRRMSATLVTWRSRIWSSVMTVIALPTRSTEVGRRVAVTTVSGPTFTCAEAPIETSAVMNTAIAHAIGVRATTNCICSPVARLSDRQRKRRNARTALS